MPRAKPKAKAPETTTNKFLDALKFCQLVLSDKGSPVETHIQLSNRSAIAFDGILAAGHLIEEDIFAAPNNKLMIEALSKCGQNLSITQLDNNRISIKSDKFKAIVPCVEIDTLPKAKPDNPVAIINDTLKKAIEVVGVLASEDAQTVHASSILIKSGSTLATNGYIIFEYWHGIDLPTLALPKSFVVPIVKCTKKLIHLGFSDNSATFWFEDKSWIRSQLYRDPWPDIAHILNQQTNMRAIPNGFWEGLDAVAPFAKEGLVYFDKGFIRSHSNSDEGASYEIEGLPSGVIFNLKNLFMLKPFAKIIDFVAHGNGLMLMFQGDNIRGAMLGRM